MDKILLKLITKAERFEDNLRRGKLKKLSNEELVLRRTELERDNQIKDMPSGGRMGFGMSANEILAYNDIIYELERRNLPRPGYIDPNDKFAEQRQKS